MKKDIGYLIIIGSVICFIMTYTIVFVVYQLNLSPAWLSYIQSLYHIGVVIIILGFILNQVAEHTKNVHDNTAEAGRLAEAGFVEVEHLFMQNYPELFPLYKELNQHNKILQSTPNPKNINPTKRVQFEYSICNIILQKIENIYSLGLSIPDYKESDEFQEWLITWKQWFKSPTLRRVWHSNKNVFARYTQNFIDNEILTSTKTIPKGSTNKYVFGPISYSKNIETALY